MWDGEKCAHIKLSEGDVRLLKEDADFPDHKRLQLKQNGQRKQAQYCGWAQQYYCHSGAVVH